MNYEVVELKEKLVVGVFAVTNNSSSKMSEVIGTLWKDFYSGVAQNLKNRSNKKAIGLYCDYKQNGDYTVLVGSEVSSNEGNDKKLLCKTIPSGRYAKFTLKGNVIEEVSKSWKEIWNTPLERTFTGDFEEYQEDCDANNGTVIIYIAIK